MSNPNRKLTPQEIAALPCLDFDVIDDEPWVRIKLKDGTVLKVRSIVGNVKRIMVKNPDGTYQYAVQFVTHIRVIEDVLNLNK